MKIEEKNGEVQRVREQREEEFCISCPIKPRSPENFQYFLWGMIKFDKLIRCGLKMLLVMDGYLGHF